jgi:hypothetical protein
MRDFHSNMRSTPFLDELRKKSVFIPMGRGQGHDQGDSLNAEMTGQWTARYTNSKLTKEGFIDPNDFWLPKTVLEYLSENNYKLITCIGASKGDEIGTHAVIGGMKEVWLKDQPGRMKQFNSPFGMNLDEWLSEIKKAKGRFYAHIFLRDTHRPWGDFPALRALVAGKGPCSHEEDIFCMRKASLEKPDELAALRRKGLKHADKRVQKIFDATKGMKNVTYILYSNHGEMYDYLRYNLPLRNLGNNLILGTSHGPYPYEALYANMQMWLIPGFKPGVMQGIARMIDFAPTVLHLGGISHKPMDGQSMLGFFKKGNFPQRCRYAEDYKGCCGMVRKDNYKFISVNLLSELMEEKQRNIKSIISKCHSLAVFDLNTDPWEYNNLINTSKGREVLKWAIAEHRKLKNL